jgi:hypothetical protein
MSSITVSPGNTTLIKKIVVGTPVRNIAEARADINQLDGIDTSNKVNGSVLVYNATNSLWEATLDLEQQNVNGGSF